MSNKVSMEFVQSDERAWGTDQYLGRPSLAELLESPIVAVWVDDPFIDPRRIQVKPDRSMLTVHPAADDFHEVLIGAIMVGKRTEATGRKLSRIFANQKLINIIGVRIVSGQSAAPTAQPSKQEDSHIKKQNEHRREAAKLMPYSKPKLVSRVSADHFVSKSYRYECLECGAVLNAPSAVGSPHCPNCASDMRRASR